MRIMLAIAAVAAALLCGIPMRAGPLSAASPGARLMSVGTGDVYWDCQYRTFEECVPNVLAGNRGFCNHNPGYVGEPASAHRS